MILSPHLDTSVDKCLLCGCGCGMGTRLEHWRPELLALFEAVRTALGRPLAITSGWRCPRHNAKVSVAEKSQHAIGAALNVACPKLLEYQSFYSQAEYAARVFTNGQGGVGFYPSLRFVHVDLGLSGRPGRRWSA